MRFGTVTLVAATTLALGTTLIPAAPAMAQSCVAIGKSIYCGTRGAQNRVGNTVIFNQGRPGFTLGDLLIIQGQRGSRVDRVLPAERKSGATPPGVPPGRAVDANRGKRFGAFEFPVRSGFVSRGGGMRGGLTPSGPN